MNLKNLKEKQVMDVIDKILKNRDDVCKCNKCKLDIAAIALNNLKPKYVVTEKGSLYAKSNILDYQYDVDLIKEVTKAIEIVKEKPRHDETR
ncbi:competence protein ComFB [Keratinibaculum paraultunense]|uniref:Competence protein ComFB n=1 Tax=Keratinibaculum paraultunense TaxID=1278232 RepID=A0A4R3L295_9FIRM|nr:late competence development ComFB family protein [Keratinibaculum paraultunense]QQY80601.1 late competence development ComFB family protein [Keratinibaculum paraultunense]TCS91331.1 competence protein ComFB [Keratinibaculum paraultunense]